MSNNESILTGDNSVHRILKTDIHKDPNQQEDEIFYSMIILRISDKWLSE